MTKCWGTLQDHRPPWQDGCWNSAQSKGPPFSAELAVSACLCLEIVSDSLRWVALSQKWPCTEPSAGRAGYTVYRGNLRGIEGLDWDSTEVEDARAAECMLPPDGSAFGNTYLSHQPISRCLTCGKARPIGYCKPVFVCTSGLPAE